MSDTSWLPAEVPGHVHLDLLRAGVIPDPFNRLHERTVAWVDESDWVYEKAFYIESPVADLTYLRFNGLDTIAEISLNGELLGSTDNMFIAHEFPVADRLRIGPGSAGENTLQITFRSALKTGLARQSAWNDAGNDTLEGHWNSWSSRSFIRKAQYTYGWDWGPVLISCGIWQSVELVQVPVARIVDYRYMPDFAADGSATVHIEATVERASSCAASPLTFVVALGESAKPVRDDVMSPLTAEAVVPADDKLVKVECDIVVPNAKRWWPNGSGKPNLYDLRMSVESAGDLADVRGAKIGLRQVELIREPDADGKGEGFLFRVNGQDTFVKGANWIPDDSFPARIHKTENGVDLVEHQIRLAVDAGYNMLRIWGGGLYESERFYELCDQYGLMVWQDFAYACAYYPDTGEYAEAARVEAVASVRRIRNHPSLALWCGNNENHTMYHDGWFGRKPSRFLGEHLYHDLLPSVVEAEDPNTPYWPSSPFGGDDPGSQDYGDRHNWNVWHGVGDWKHYLEDRSRFASEFGFAASCGLNAWKTCLGSEDRHAHSPAVRWHDKTRKGYDTYLGLVALHFDMPETVEDLVYYTQVNQLEALKCGIEHYRRLKGRCWGVLFWQINDCWPVQSWAVIDSIGEPKAAFYESRKFFAPVLLSLARTEAGIEVHVTSDRMEPVTGRVQLSLKTFAGDALSTQTFDAAVAANGAAHVGTLDIAELAGRENEVYLYAEFTPDQPEVAAQPAGLTNYLFLADQKNWQIANPRLAVRVDDSQADHFELTFSAGAFAPYVWLHIGCVDGERLPYLSDNFFHVQAGEEVRLRIAKTAWLSRAEDLCGRLTVRTLGSSGLSPVIDGSGARISAPARR
jgi:beta-mannosidase